MAENDNHIPPDHLLPLPEFQRPETLASEFTHPEHSDARRVGDAFADPNSLDDRRLGHDFEKTTGKKDPKPPILDRVHKPANRRALYLTVTCILVLFLLVFLLGWLPRHSRDKETRKQAETERTAEPVVEVARVKRETNAGGLVIPGTTAALTEAYVYARANGYLRTRLVDIGDHVRKNQLLAIIDSPDLDAQVDQAREQVRQTEAQLAQQKSQLALATVTVERYRILVAKGVFSRQEGDQREADFRAQQANVAAAERNVEAFKANLKRTIALQSYEQVRAPFAGVITQRNVDVGALISASGSSGGASSGPSPQGQSSTSGGSQQGGQSNNSGSSGNPNTSATSQQSAGQGGPLFGIADTTRLRVLVSVPEGYATSIRPGMKAQLNFQEFPQAPFFGEVTRASGAVDQNTRTILTEVQLDNAAAKLMPGMYVVTTFPPAPGLTSPLLVPGDAVALRHDQTVIGSVVDGKVRIVPIVLGRDYGPSIEVLSGLREGDTIITNMTDDVVEGVKVKTHGNAQQQEAASQKPEQAQPPGGSTQYGNNGVTDQNLQGKQTQQNQKATGKQPKNDATSGSKP